MPRWLKNHSNLLRGLFSLSLLLLLLIVVDFDALLSSLGTIHWLFYPASIGIAFTASLLGALKWAVIYPDVNFRELFRLSIIGHFYAFVFPSSIGGDVARVLHSNVHNGHRIELGISVAIDRIVGALSLLCIVIATLLLRTSLIARKLDLGVMGPLLLLILAGTVLFSGVARNALLSILIALTPETRIAQRLLGGIQEVASSIDRLSNLRAIVLSFLLSTVFQLVSSLQVYILVTHFNMPISFSDCIMISGVVQLLSALPAGIGGVGLKDISVVAILKDAGASLNDASAIVALMYPSAMILAILGWYLSIRHQNAR